MNRYEIIISCGNCTNKWAIKAVNEMEAIKKMISEPSEYQVTVIINIFYCLDKNFELGKAAVQGKNYVYANNDMIANKLYKLYTNQTEGIVPDYPIGWRKHFRYVEIEIIPTVSDNDYIIKRLKKQFM